MHNATELLQRQLHAYSDSWRFERRRDVPPWELEGWLEAGVSIFRLIRRLEEHLDGDRGAAARWATCTPSGCGMPRARWAG